MASQIDRRKYVHRRLTPWRCEKIPEEFMRFAQRRVGYLEGRAFEEPIRYLLACAYLQGINDCVQAHANNPGAFNLGFDPKDISRDADSPFTATGEAMIQQSHSRKPTP